jgi:hypothetical protein
MALDSGKYFARFVGGFWSHGRSEIWFLHKIARLILLQCFFKQENLSRLACWAGVPSTVFYALSSMHMRPVVAFVIARVGQETLT